MQEIHCLVESQDCVEVRSVIHTFTALETGFRDQKMQ